MPDFRATIGEKHSQMFESLVIAYGYEGKSARANTLAHLISEAYAKNGYSNRWGDLRAKAARTLSILRNWPSPLRPNEIKAMSFRDGSISISTTLSGEPYQIRESDWENND